MENTTNKVVATFKSWSIYLKIFFILFLVLMLMIPKFMIEDLIYERQRLQEDVQMEIAQAWGQQQSIQGPLLQIPYFTQGKDDEFEFKHYFYVTPSSTDFDVQVNTEERKKSIYSAVLYKSTVDLNGTFEMPADLSKEVQNLKRIAYNEAKLVLGISSPASIDKQIIGTMNGKPLQMAPGIPNQKIVSKGVHSGVELTDADKLIEFSLPIQLKGSSAISFDPAGQESNITMASNWHSPGFIGNLPEERTITDDGFTASWKTNVYSQTFPPFWSDLAFSMSNYSNSITTKFIQPVDHYQKNLRSVKYALMILSLSFTLFFFFEVLNKTKIHPVQYLLVAASLLIFYVLLLSLSEQIGFLRSYVIASFSTIILITWYCSSILNNRKATFSLFGLLTMLYGYIYTLLQLETYALLVGSIGLFAIIALIMFATKRIDWYNLNNT